MTWYLILEDLEKIIIPLTYLLIGGSLISISVLITRAVVRDTYYHLLEERLNEINNNIVFRYKQKVVECNRLKQQLQHEKALRKSAVELLRRLIGGLNK